MYFCLYALQYLFLVHYFYNFLSKQIDNTYPQMGRWVKPEVYPLMAAMTFVTGMCIFQLTRNMLLNPDVRINKAHRTTAVLENEEEGERYAQHGLRKYLRTRSPEIMHTINSFFSDTKYD